MYVLSIDLGTSGLKVALVGESGDLAATATRSVHTQMLPPDGAEQDANEIWAAVVSAARQVLRAAGGAALVGIALVLSSVFIPAAFIAGITGALYRQFALTIAFSVLISAFNALTLSPALGALLLRPRRAGGRRGILGRFFAGFERAFGSAQTGYVRGAQFLIRKVGVALVVLVAFAALAGGLGKTLPTSFMPQEDQGFFFMNVQLPEAASMQRTNAVMRKIDEILKDEPGVHYLNAVAGYSLLSQTASPRNGLYFVQLAPYEERATRRLPLQDVERMEKLGATLRALRGAALPVGGAASLPSQRQTDKRP